MVVGGINGTVLRKAFHCRGVTCSHGMTKLEYVVLQMLSFFQLAVMCFMTVHTEAFISFKILTLTFLQLDL